MDTSNEIFACPTCIEPSIREECYQKIDNTYNSTASDSVTVEVQSGEYYIKEYIGESSIAERIRKLNKLVAKWR